MRKLSLKDLGSQLSALKNNTKVVMTLMVLILIFDAGVLLRGQFSSLLRQFVKAKEMKAKIEDVRKDKQFFSTYKDRVADLKTEEISLNKKIIAEEDLPAVIEAISKFADISMVRILKIKPISDPLSAQRSGAAGMAQDFAREKISIMAKSGFHQLGRFIALLENSPVFLNIKSIEIRTDEQEHLKQTDVILLEVVLR